MEIRSSSQKGSSDFVLHTIKGRWFSVYAAFLIMSGCGATYIFGAYSKDIKVSLGYDQSTLRSLAFYKDFGSNFAVLNGLFAEIAPTWLTLLLGAGLNFWGYLMIWLAVTKKIAKPRLWQMCLYFFVGANSQNFSGTPAIVTCIRNFPESRGVVLGLLKSYVGLSGVIITQFYLAIYGNNPTSLILFIGWFPSVLAFVFMFTFQSRKIFTRQPHEIRVFYHLLYLSIGMGMFLLAMTISQRHIVFSSTAYAGSAIVVFVFLFILPLLIVIREEHFTWKFNITPRDPYTKANIETPQAIQSKANHETGSEHECESSSSNSSCFSNIFDKPGRGEDHTILQAILSMDMLYLFVTATCGLGAGLTAINNLERIGEALGYPPETIRSFASLVSIWNYVGRVFSGFSSEYLLRKHRVPRPAMLTFMLALSSLGYILVAFPFLGSIHVASVIIGFSFGSQLPLANAIISELFGLRHFSTLFSCGQLVSPFGAYILNEKIVQPSYTRMAGSLGMDESKVEDLICSGELCFKDSFTVLASVAILAAFVSQILMERTRKFYDGDVYKRFRNTQANSADAVTSSAR